jgi:hypothetical protein
MLYRMECSALGFACCVPARLIELRGEGAALPRRSGEVCERLRYGTWLRALLPASATGPFSLALAVS